MASHEMSLAAGDVEKWECMVSNSVATSSIAWPSLRMVEYLGGGRGLVHLTPSHGESFAVIWSILWLKKSVRALLVAASYNR